MRRAPSKYHARRTTVEGITFHSAKEARRYQDLKLLRNAGMVQSLELQPAFVLTTVSEIGEVLPVGVYRADFGYQERRDVSGKNWETVVEDVKGYDTPLSKWKRKHVKAQYGIEVRLT